MSRMLSSARVSLPDETAHRTWADIRALIRGSADLVKMNGVRRNAVDPALGFRQQRESAFGEAFALRAPVCAELFARLSPSRMICGPLPLCDGTVKCEHGLLPAPAPAVLELLQGVPVRGLASEGETITPTAIALLKGLGAEFGAWPEMTVARTALVYGGRILPGIANGATFALGSTNGAAGTRLPSARESGGCGQPFGGDGQDATRPSP